MNTTKSIGGTAMEPSELGVALTDDNFEIDRARSLGYGHEDVVRNDQGSPRTVQK
jgi:hypothetical protein